MKFPHLSNLAAAACLVTFSACDKARDNASQMQEKARETVVNAEEKAREAMQATEEKAREIVQTTREKIADATGSTETYAEADKAAFNAALEPVKKLYEEVVAADQSGEPPIDKMSEFIAAMKAIPTTGMPAELKDAMAAANDKAGEFIEAMKSILDDPAAPTPEVQAQLAKLKSEGEVLGEKAIELAAKHGIDLSFME